MNYKIQYSTQEPITRVVTADGDYTISILFSGDHYDCLILKNDDKSNRNADFNVDKEDLKNKSHAAVKELIRNYNLPNDYPTKYSNETLKSILEYLKNGKYHEGIEEMRRKKNEIITKNESTKKLKRKATTKLDDARRHSRNLMKKDIKHKLCEYELNGKKYISLKEIGLMQSRKMKTTKILREGLAL